PRGRRPLNRHVLIPQWFALPATQLCGANCSEKPFGNIERAAHPNSVVPPHPSSFPMFSELSAVVVPARPASSRLVLTRWLDAWLYAWLYRGDESGQSRPLRQARRVASRWRSTSAHAVRSATAGGTRDARTA